MLRNSGNADTTVLMQMNNIERFNISSAACDNDRRAVKFLCKSILTVNWRSPRLFFYVLHIADYAVGPPGVLFSSRVSDTL